VIRFNFDHHQCTDCVSAKREHRIRASLVDGAYFWFCTACGFEEGPYATLPSGERVAVARSLVSMPSPEEAQYRDALRLVRQSGKASTSWLQRQMRIGYNSAARLIEQMERAGVVSAPDDVGRREVLDAAGDDETPSPAFAEPIDETDDAELLADEDEHAEISALVDELSERFGVHDREGLIAAISEARAIREAARATEPGSPAVLHLTQIVDRAETLIGEREAINGTLRDLFSFAKDIGFNVKAIRACIAARAILPELRKIQEAEVKVYRDALGIEGPEFAVTMPVPMLEAAQPRAVPRKVQARRDSVALAHLAEMARGN
jgi:uncharacterized protein (UPF0335 family)